jgi:hypothetical protein
MGWQLGYGRVFLRVGTVYLDGNTESLSQCLYFYQDESGAQHELYQSDASQNYLGSSTTPVAGTWYFTNDGSYLRARYNAGTWTIFYPDGSQRVAGGTAPAYVQAIPNQANMVPNADGTQYYPEGLQNVWSNGWYVTSVTDIAGNTINVSYLTPNSPGDPGYNASNPLVLPGSISKIGDPFGRSIVFSYNSDAGLNQGLLAAISATGANGQALTESYSYTSGTFAQESLPLLQKVTTPDGLQTVYGYGSHPDESGTPYMYLTQIGYPTGAVSSYTYGGWSYTASTPPGVFEATGDWTSRTWSSVVVASHTLTLGASGDPGTTSSLTWQYNHVSSLQNYLGRIANGYKVQSMPVIVTDPLGTQEAHFIAFDDLLGSAGTLLPGGHEIAVIRYAPGDSCDTSTPTSPSNGRVFEKDLYYSSGQGVNDYERLGDAGHCGVYMGGTAWSSLDLVPNGNPRVWKVVEAKYSPTSEGTPLWSRETRNAFWDGFGHYLVSEVGQTSAFAGTGASGQSYAVLRATISQYTLLVTGTTAYQTNQLAVRYKGGDSTNGPFPPANTLPAGTLAVTPLTTPLPSTDDGGAAALRTPIRSQEERSLRSDICTIPRGFPPRRRSTRPLPRWSTPSGATPLGGAGPGRCPRRPPPVGISRPPTATTATGTSTPSPTAAPATPTA